MKQISEEIPESKYKEHEIFWIRIQLPFVGNGTQLLVDEAGTLKLNLTAKNKFYFKIRDEVKVTCIKFMSFSSLIEIYSYSCFNVANIFK